MLIDKMHSNHDPVRKGLGYMALRKIRYFLSIVENGSLSKAAQDLYLTQPTLSRFLAKLEEEVGHELFLRQKDNSLKKHYW